MKALTVVASINVINLPRIEAYLETVKNQPDHDRPLIQKWIGSNLRNWLLRESNPNRIHLTDRRQFSLLGIHQEPTWLKGKPLPDNLYFVPLNPTVKGTIETALRDIVARVVIEQAKDVSKVTVEEALKNGEQRHLLQRQLLEDEHYERDGVEDIMTCTDGSRWVTIKTLEGLKRETKYMGHCLGMNGHIEGYWTKIVSGQSQIWSLRDRSNIPHCTVEVNVPEKEIRQIRSKGVSILDQYNGLSKKYWHNVWELFASPRVKQRVHKISRSELNLNFQTGGMRNKQTRVLIGGEPQWESHVQGYQIT